MKGYRMQKIGSDFGKSKAIFKTKKEAEDFGKHVVPHVKYKIYKVK